MSISGCRSHPRRVAAVGGSHAGVRRLGEDRPQVALGRKGRLKGTVEDLQVVPAVDPLAVRLATSTSSKYRGSGMWITRAFSGGTSPAVGRAASTNFRSEGKAMTGPRRSDGLLRCS